MPILFDHGAGGQGGEVDKDKEKEKALQVVKEEATKAAQAAFEAKAKDLLKSELGSEESKALIKSIAESIVSELKVKHNDKESVLEDVIKSLQTQCDKLSAKLNGQGGQDQVKSFAGQVREELDKEQEALKSLYGANNGQKINIKAATTTITTSLVSPEIATAKPFTLTSFDSEIDSAPKRPVFMRQLVRVIPTSNMYVAWAEKTIEGGAAWTAEAAKKNQMSIKFQERSKKVEKVTAFVKVSKEALADIGFLMAEINGELRDAIELKLDESILGGSGTTPEIQGILEVAPDFVAPSTLEASIPNANRFDVIVAAYTQVVSENFIPTVVVVNPLDLAAMQTTKDANGNYILPPFQSVNGDIISGLRVVANNGVEAGTFLVGDFSKNTLAIREELNIQIGYENDDFTKNLVTILAEMRVANYIKNHQINAFVQGTFSDAIGDLTLPDEEETPEA